MTFWKVLTPHWLGSLLSFIKVPVLSGKHALTETSFREINIWINEIIDSAKIDYLRKTSGDDESKGHLNTKENGALLRRLVQANIADLGSDGQPKLSDVEVTANALVRRLWTSNFR